MDFWSLKARLKRLVDIPLHLDTLSPERAREVKGNCRREMCHALRRNTSSHWLIFDAYRIVKEQQKSNRRQKRRRGASRREANFSIGMASTRCQRVIKKNG